MADVPTRGTSPSEREYFTRVMDEAREERSHQERLAEIEAQRQVDLVAAKRDESWTHKEWKKNLVVGILVGVFLTFMISAFWYGVIRVHESDRLKFERQNEQTQRTAQECIKEGNIWLNNSCLIANKGAVAK